MIRIFKTQPIEVTVGAGALSYPFKDQPNLRNAIITKIEILTTALIGKSPLNFLTVATEADYKNCFLTLNVGTDQDLKRYPSLLFNPVAKDGTSYVNVPDTIKDKIFSWDKCSVDFCTAPSGDVTICLNVHYDDRPEAIEAAGYAFEKGNWVYKGKK